MTKSTITKEWLQQTIAELESVRDEIPFGIDTNSELELAAFKMALAAMDSEPVAVTDDMAYAFHHALTDSMIGADDVEEIKTGLRAVFANLTAPVVSAEYPDRLPCSVLLEPGLRFGKGIKTSTMLAALARRAVHESDMAALSSEERAEFQARIEGLKALIAQSAPVVQDEREAFEAFMAKQFGSTVNQQRANNGDRGYVAWDMVVAWIVWQARAAMLQAEPVTAANKLPETQFKQVADLYEMQFDDGRTCAFHTDAEKAVQWLNTCDGNKVQEYVKLERLHDAFSGNSPVIPDGLIAAVNRLLDSDGSRGCYSAIQCGDAHDEIERLLAAAPQEVKDE